jgi:uncharacterized protein with FMN-binding domain
VKKIFFGFAVGVVFLAYSYVLRNQHSSPVIAPTSLTQTSTTTSTNSSSPSQTPTTSGYKDGTFTGSVEDAYYGNVQVSATIASGKITAVNFLQYPNDNPNSMYVNSQAVPYLKQEAVQAQSANVNIITGATLTSQAFIQSLATALNQAKQG